MNRSELNDILRPTSAGYFTRLYSGPLNALDIKIQHVVVKEVTNRIELGNEIGFIKRLFSFRPI